MPLAAELGDTTESNRIVRGRTVWVRRLDLEKNVGASTGKSNEFWVPLNVIQQPSDQGENLNLLQHAWQLCTSPDGKPYYYHKSTKKTAWKLPDIEDAEDTPRAPANLPCTQRNLEATNGNIEAGNTLYIKYCESYKGATATFFYPQGKREQKELFWVQIFDKASGKPYYYNKTRNRTEWYLPDITQPEMGLLPQHQTVETEDEPESEHTALLHPESPDAGPRRGVPSAPSPLEDRTNTIPRCTSSPPYLLARLNELSPSEKITLRGRKNDDASHSSENVDSTHEDERRRLLLQDTQRAAEESKRLEEDRRLQAMVEARRAAEVQRSQENERTRIETQNQARAEAERQLQLEMERLHREREQREKLEERRRRAASVERQQRELRLRQEQEQKDRQEKERKEREERLRKQTEERKRQAVLETERRVKRLEREKRKAEVQTDESAAKDQLRIAKEEQARQAATEARKRAETTRRNQSQNKHYSRSQSPSVRLSYIRESTVAYSPIDLTSRLGKGGSIDLNLLRASSPPPDSVPNTAPRLDENAPEDHTDCLPQYSDDSVNERRKVATKATNRDARQMQSTQKEMITSGQELASESSSTFAASSPPSSPKPADFPLVSLQDTQFQCAPSDIAAGGKAKDKELEIREQRRTMETTTSDTDLSLVPRPPKPSKSPARSSLHVPVQSTKWIKDLEAKIRSKDEELEQVVDAYKRRILELQTKTCCLEKQTGEGPVTPEPTTHSADCGSFHFAVRKTLHAGGTQEHKAPQSVTGYRSPTQRALRPASPSTTRSASPASARSHSPDRPKYVLGQSWDRVTQKPSPCFASRVERLTSLTNLSPHINNATYCVTPTGTSACEARARPGPGHYDPARSSPVNSTPRSPSSSSSGRYRSPVNARERRVASATCFSSKAPRLSPVLKDQTPGPGTYSPTVTPDFVRLSASSPTNSSRTGFGSSAPRFSSPLPSVLGPGCYDRP